MGGTPGVCTPDAPPEKEGNDTPFLSGVIGIQIFLENRKIIIQMIGFQIAL